MPNICFPLIDIAQRAVRLDLRSVEESPVLPSVRALCGEVGHLTRDAAEAAEHVCRHYDPRAGCAEDAPTADDLCDEPAMSTPFLTKIDAVAEGDTGRRQIIDLASIGAWTLRRKSAVLGEAVESADPWRTIGECASAKRMIIKAATTIERAAAAVEGVPSEIAHLYTTELDRSLGVRALYRRFLTDLHAEAPPDASTIEPRLRVVSVSLARIFGHAVYDDLRIEDRHLFRDLQAQVFAWMRERKSGAPPELSARAGLHLFQNIAVFAQCLMVVNNRSELKEHDRHLAAEALARLEERGAASPDRVELGRRLRLLLGRDTELDRLLRGEGALPLDQLRDALRRVAIL